MFLLRWTYLLLASVWIKPFTSRRWLWLVPSLFICVSEKKKEKKFFSDKYSPINSLPNQLPLRNNRNFLAVVCTEHLSTLPRSSYLLICHTSPFHSDLFYFCLLSKLRSTFYNLENDSHIDGRQLSPDMLDKIAINSHVRPRHKCCKCLVYTRFLWQERKRDFPTLQCLSRTISEACTFFHCIYHHFSFPII